MRLPFFRALRNPSIGLVLLLSLFFGLFAAWWLFPLGLVVYGAMVYSVLNDPALILNFEIESRSPLAQRFQTPFNHIQRGQVTLFNNLRSAKQKVRQSLQPLQMVVDTLTRQAYALCQRMTNIQNYYLVTKSKRDFDGELFVLKVKLENTTEEKSRQDFLESIQMLEEQANEFRRISTLLDRVEAHLSNVGSNIDSAVLDALRLQGSSDAEIREQLPLLLQPIQSQIDQLSVFEKDASRLVL